MDRHVRFGTITLAALAVWACSGDHPTPPGGATVTVSGTVTDDFSLSQVDHAFLQNDAPSSVVGVFSEANGHYQFDAVPTSSDLNVTASGTGYRPTRNPVILVASANVVHALAIVSVSDANRQYVGLGLLPGAGKGVVFATLTDNAGTPLIGVPLADVHLVNTSATPVGLGPFVFGAGGDVVSSATLSATASFGGRSRVAFLDVPPGVVTFSVTFLVGGTPQTASATIRVAADGATLVHP